MSLRSECVAPFGHFCHLKIYFPQIVIAIARQTIIVIMIMAAIFLILYAIVWCAIQSVCAVEEGFSGAATIADGPSSIYNTYYYYRKCVS